MSILISLEIRPWMFHHIKVVFECHYSSKMGVVGGTNMGDTWLSSRC
jgi:hypothetical protein